MIFGTNDKESMKNDFYVSAKYSKQDYCYVDVNLLAWRIWGEGGGGKRGQLW